MGINRDDPWKPENQYGLQVFHNSLQTGSPDSSILPFMQFKPGDVVMLKSGGPKMTVSAKTAGGTSWICQWFVGGEIKESVIPDAALTKPENYGMAEIPLIGKAE